MIEPTRVVILGMYYAPEVSGSAPYTTDLAEHLAARGHKVTMITTYPHYPEWKQRGRSRWFVRRSEVNGVTVIRVPAFVPRNPTLATRLLYEISFVATAGPLTMLSRADLYVGTTPNILSAVAVRAVATVRRKPHVQVLQDLVSSALTQTAQGTEQGRAAKATRAVEKWALGAAAVITVPGPSFERSLRRLGVTSRIEIIRNWTRTKEDFNDTTISAEYLKRTAGWPKRTIVLHTGNMGQKQGLDELSPAIQTIAQEEPGIHFVFVGDGNRKGALVSVTSGLPNVTISPSLPDAEFALALRSADVLLVHESAAVRDMSLPSKLTSYFASGKPVVAVVHDEGATAEELRTSGGGLIVKQGDAEALLAAIRIAVDDHDTRDRIVARAREHRTRAFDQTTNLARLSSLIDEAINEVA